MRPLVPFMKYIFVPKSNEHKLAVCKKLGCHGFLPFKIQWIVLDKFYLMIKNRRVEYN